MIRRPARDSGGSRPPARPPPRLPAVAPGPAPGRQPRAAQPAGAGVAVRARHQHRHRRHRRRARHLPVVQVGPAERARPARQPAHRAGRQHAPSASRPSCPPPPKAWCRASGRSPTSTEIGSIANTYVYRNSFVPAIDTNGISLTATDAALPATLGASLAHGTFLNAATARYPAVVLGAEAASLLGINNLAHPTQVWIGGHWFTVVGILNPVELVTQMDSMAFIGFPDRRAVLRLRRPPHRAVPAQRAQPGQRRRRRAARHRQPGQPLDRAGQPTVRHPRKPRWPPRAPTTGCSSASAPWPSSSAASASPTSWSSRSSNAAPRSACAAPWAPPAATSPSSSSPKALLLSVLGGVAGTDHRRGGDRHLRRQPALVGADPRPGPLRRDRRRPGHRRHRRPVPVDASRPPLADRGAAHGVIAVVTRLRSGVR